MTNNSIHYVQLSKWVTELTQERVPGIYSLAHKYVISSISWISLVLYDVWVISANQLLSLDILNFGLYLGPHIYSW